MNSRKPTPNPELRSKAAALIATVETLRSVRKHLDPEASFLEVLKRTAYLDGGALAEIAATLDAHPAEVVEAELVKLWRFVNEIDA